MWKKYKLVYWMLYFLNAIVKWRSIFEIATYFTCKDCVNSSLCIENPNGNAFCTCKPGFIGAKCETGIWNNMNSLNEPTEN